MRRRAFEEDFLAPPKIAWWAQVTVTPDARRIEVLRRGIEYGLMGEMPAGGQVEPKGGVGASLLWKKAQKKEKKNATSEMIKRTIPRRRPRTTGEVWWPI